MLWGEGRWGRRKIVTLGKWRAEGQGESHGPTGVNPVPRWELHCAVEHRRGCLSVPVAPDAWCLWFCPWT